MTEFDSIKEGEINRAILVGLNAHRQSVGEIVTEASMAELEALLETAGGTCLATMIQNRETPDPGSFIGEGKAQELKELVGELDADLVIFDNALSPTQVRVLTELVGVQVMDRAGLILDIFAKRAQTKEGRLQVELAQYKYILPRLTGMWGHLVRQTAAGGKSPIGTRGPGETQLESDRRHIRRKIQQLEEDLREVRRVRAVQRERREKNEVPVVAIVGYTNAGKSTLLNQLTDAGIPANNRLFDTLDTTTRTLGYADLLLHVIDVSREDWQDQAEVVDKLIRELGAEQTPCIRVFNKCDLCAGDILPHGEDIVSISAKTGAGADELLQAIAKRLDNGVKKVTLRLPYDRGGVLDQLYREAKVESVEYGETIEVVAHCTPKVLGQVRQYVWPPMPEPKEDWE